MLRRSDQEGARFLSNPIRGGNNDIPAPNHHSAGNGGRPHHPHWVTPDNLWRDRLAVLAEWGAWLAGLGPRPVEPDCRVPPALLPENKTRRENAYLLWH